MKWLTLIAATLMLGCAHAKPADDDDVTHVVVVWTKTPGDPAARQALTERSFEFQARIDGLKRVTVGEPLPATSRPGIDSSYDLLIVMQFEDVAALRAYEAHPEHRRAVAEVLRPLSERVVIYDAQMRVDAGGCRP